MDREQLKSIVESTTEYDETREDTIRAWLRDAYCKRMRWVTLGVNIGYLLLVVPIVISVVIFFRTDNTTHQIACAVVFVSCSHWIGFLSVFGWVMMQRPRLNREVKRLELRIAESIEMLKSRDTSSQ